MRDQVFLCLRKYLSLLFNCTLTTIEENKYIMLGSCKENEEYKKAKKSVGVFYLKEVFTTKMIMITTQLLVLFINYLSNNFNQKNALEYSYFMFKKKNETTKIMLQNLCP